MNQDEEIKQKAADYIKNNKDELIEKFAPEDKYPQEESPISIFMIYGRLFWRRED